MIADPTQLSPLPPASKRPTRRAVSGLLRASLAGWALAFTLPANAAAEVSGSYDWGLFIAGGLGILGLLWLRRQVNRL